MLNRNRHSPIKPNDIHPRMIGTTYCVNANVNFFFTVVKSNKTTSARSNSMAARKQSLPNEKRLGGTTHCVNANVHFSSPLLCQA